MPEPTTETDAHTADGEPDSARDAAGAAAAGGTPSTATANGTTGAEPDSELLGSGVALGELPDDAIGDGADADSSAESSEPATGSSDIAVGSSDVVAAADAEPEDAPLSGEALLVQEGEIAGDYLEQLLDILDYDGDIDLDVEGSRAIVAIVGADDLDPLVGARGVTLDALQELTRLTVAQQTGVRTRLMLDVGGYRAGRRTELSALAATSVSRVIESGETLLLTPMNAFERKIVHDVVTATDGVRSESEGEEPDRRVVILPDR